MNDLSLQSLFSGRKGFVLVSSDEFQQAPPIEGIEAGISATYPPGWGALSATSSKSLIEISLSEGESDWKKFDVLDNLCTARQYISFQLSQLSMEPEVFERTFGAGSWDSTLGAYRADGLFTPIYKSMLICFFGREKIMALYFSRVKLFPGDSLLKAPDGYFMEIPLKGFVQEPFNPGGKYVVYRPRPHE